MLAAGFYELAILRVPHVFILDLVEDIGRVLVRAEGIYRPAIAVRLSELVALGPVGLADRDRVRGEGEYLGEVEKAGRGGRS